MEKLEFDEKLRKHIKSVGDEFKSFWVDKNVTIPFVGIVLMVLYNKKGEFDSENFTGKEILKVIRNELWEIIDTSMQLNNVRNEIDNVLKNKSLNKIGEKGLGLIIEKIKNVYDFYDENKKDGKVVDVLNYFVVEFWKENIGFAKGKGELCIPEHIIELMFELGKCSSKNVILEPNCTTGGFLVKTMELMCRDCTKRKSLLLTDKIIKKDSLIGISNDKNYELISNINLMLHGDGFACVYEGKFSDVIEKLENVYDRALIYPSVEYNEKELEFVLKTLDNMEIGGIAVAIVPVSSILKGDVKRNKKAPNNLKWKKELLKKHNVLGIVRLPKRLFHPFVITQTALLVVQAKKKYCHKTWRKNFLDDGFEIYRNLGRIDRNCEKKINEFKKAKVDVVDLNEEMDWPLFDEINFKEIENKDINRQKINLVKEYWDYVNENKITKIDKNINKLIKTTLMNDNDFDFRSWKEFRFGDIFKVECGKEVVDINNNDNKNGLIPLITGTKYNNGIGMYIKNAKKIYSKNCLTFVYKGDGAAGLCFAHAVDFAVATSTYVLSNENLNPFINVFIASVLSKTHSLYDYCYMATMERLLDLKVLLPANGGSPNWKYMENYVLDRKIKRK